MGVCQLRVLTIACSLVGMVKVTSLLSKPESVHGFVFEVRAQTKEEKSYNILMDPIASD